MGLTQKLGTIPLAISTDASNNVGIGGSPSGSYKLEVTGTAKVSSTLLVSGASTLTGNVGVGIASGTTLSGLTLFQVGSNASLTATTSGIGSFYFGNNAFLNTSGSWQRINTGFASDYYQENGKHAWRTIGSGSAGSTFAYNQVMTLDASGNLGIGTAPNSGWASGYSVLQVGPAAYQMAYSNTNIIGVNEYFDGSNFRAIQTGAAVKIEMYNDVFEFKRAASVTAGSIQTYSTSMVITSGGQVNINGSAASSQVKLAVQQTLNNHASYLYVDNGSLNACVYSRIDSTANVFNYFDKSGTIVGSISFNGTNTMYNISSDYRIKSDFEDFTALNIIEKLKPSKFRVHNSENKMAGFVAHELQEFIPQAVSGIKDAIDEDGNPIYQGVDVSQIVPYLVKAIQELNQQNQDLKSRLDKAGL